MADAEASRECFFFFAPKPADLLRQKAANSREEGAEKHVLLIAPLMTVGVRASVMQHLAQMSLW